jgi:hypothetical protein
VFSVIRIAAVSKQRLGKHFLLATDTNAKIDERCSLCGPFRDVITRIVGSVSLLSSAGEDVKIKPECMKLIKAAARERLVKTQQAGRGLTGAVVICELWRLAVAL